MRRLILPILAGVIGLSGSAQIRPAQAGGNLNAVLESEVVFLDPHQTTANITRTFNFMVYDTLFAMDSKGAIQQGNRVNFSFGDQADEEVIVPCCQLTPQAQGVLGGSFS